MRKGFSPKAGKQFLNALAKACPAAHKQVVREQWHLWVPKALVLKMACDSPGQPKAQKSSPFTPPGRCASLSHSPLRGRTVLSSLKRNHKTQTCFTSWEMGRRR